MKNDNNNKNKKRKKITGYLILAVLGLVCIILFLVAKNNSTTIIKDYRIYYCQPLLDEYEKLELTSYQVESVDIDSDDNTLFAFFFDGGSTWKAYTDGRWVVLSEETSGMNRESIKAIGTDAWNDAVTDRQYKIRFALREGGYVNKITVHYLN